VSTVSRALPCGDYGVVADTRLVAAAERKSLPDLVSSVINGKLRYALGDLAALPRSAVVVEDRYFALFKQRHARPSAIADALAEYQVRWPTIPLVFCETRPPAEELTYRYLAAAWYWATTEPAAQQRTATTDPLLLTAPEPPEPTRRRSPSMGPPRRTRRPRPRQTPPRDLERLAHRPLTDELGDG
jgi:hypothetical protein